MTWTLEPVDPLATTPRYTTLEDVKKRLNVTSTSWDSVITQSIVAAELAIDNHMGGAFPLTTTGDTPTSGVPVNVKQAAENVAVAVLKQTDAPFGTAGSDDFMGELDIDDAARREITRTPLLMGMRETWGVA